MTKGKVVILVYFLLFEFEFECSSSYQSFLGLFCNYGSSAANTQ